RTHTQLHHGRRDQQRNQVHHLDQRVDRGAGGVLERITDGVTDHRRLVRLGPLTAVITVLDHLLCVVPGAPGIREENSHQRACRDGTTEIPCQRAGPDAETTRDGRENRQQPASRQFPQRYLRRQVHHRAVLRPGGAFQNARDLADLPAHLVNHGTSRAGDRVDRQYGEQEHHGRADDDSDQGVRTDDRVDEQVRGTTGRTTHLREDLLDRLRV